MQLYILGLIDHTHAAPAEFLDDAVVRDGFADQWRRLAPCATMLGGKSPRVYVLRVGRT